MTVRLDAEVNHTTHPVSYYLILKAGNPVKSHATTIS